MEKISRKYKDDDYFVEERRKDENDDMHYLIGRRDKSSDKMHVIVDKETAEIRLEDNQIIDDTVAKKITTIIELPNGKIIRTGRSAVIDEPADQNTLDYFIFLLDNHPWSKEMIKGEEVWFSSKNYNFQIKLERISDDFDESWAKNYPSQNTAKYAVYLCINGSPIKEIIFISCDGGRIFVSLPDIEYDEVINRFYWDKTSIGYKVMGIIGQFYVYNNIEGVARHSKISIK